MTGTADAVFDLPARLAAKNDPALIARDEEQLAAIAATLATAIAELSDRRDAVRRLPGGSGQAALDRDLEIHRLTARLNALSRFGRELCLGRIVRAGDAEPVYIGRLGLVDAAGERLLVDWRSPAAEPFFAATHGDPMGLTSRRRYRWTADRITDYWDEVFTPEGLESAAALDDQSAFIASLGGSRSGRMRDVLATIQSDQDAVIRAGSDGTLVVDGGPGTGKTVVALHRAAYLLYADPKLGRGHGGVLVVGPHQPYLAYVADVLPALGEEGVRLCTLRDLVDEGAAAVVEADPEVARLKADARLVAAIEPAVRLYEEPPTNATVVETPWGDVLLRPDDWAEAFATAEPGLAHNDARDQVWEALLDILLDRLASVDAPLHQVRRALVGNGSLTRAFQRAWPLVEASVVVSDLWSVPAYLRRCAPWLTAGQVRLLQRDDPTAWTVSDLPLLDAARRRLGDPRASRRRREREATLAAEQRYREDVNDYLMATDDSELGLMSILRGDDARNSLIDETVVPAVELDGLEGPFGHIVVDEAQELTDAEWQMLLARCPTRSLTIVGDRAQARHGFAESWRERLARIGLDRVTMASLTINYRTPAEIMAEAEPVIRAALPDANVPTSIRSTGVPVEHTTVDRLDDIVGDWLAAHDEGVACVIGEPGFAGTDRVRALTPETAKGLEFDLVVLVDPDAFGTGIEGAVDRYVSMTRSTGRLAILTRA